MECVNHGVCQTWSVSIMECVNHQSLPVTVCQYESIIINYTATILLIYANWKVQIAPILLQVTPVEMHEWTLVAWRVL